MEKICIILIISRTFALGFNKIREMGNKSHIFGYLLGLLIFVIGIPALMWLVSGWPWPYVPDSAPRNPMLVGIYIYDAGVLSGFRTRIY